MLTSSDDLLVKGKYPCTFSINLLIRYFFFKLKFQRCFVEFNTFDVSQSTSSIHQPMVRHGLNINWIIELIESKFKFVFYTHLSNIFYLTHVVRYNIQYWSIKASSTSQPIIKHDPNINFSFNVNLNSYFMHVFCSIIRRNVRHQSIDK